MCWSISLLPWVDTFPILPRFQHVLPGSPLSRNTLFTLFLSDTMSWHPLMQMFKSLHLFPGKLPLLVNAHHAPLELQASPGLLSAGWFHRSTWALTPWAGHPWLGFKTIHQPILSSGYLPNPTQGPKPHTGPPSQGGTLHGGATTSQRHTLLPSHELYVVSTSPWSLHCSA